MLIFYFCLNKIFPKMVDNSFKFVKSLLVTALHNTLTVNCIHLREKQVIVYLLQT